MAVLGHAVLRGDSEANRLLVEGTDLVTGVSGVMVAHVDETGGVAVSADAFYRVLQAAVTDVVEVTAEENNLTVKAGRSRWKLPCMEAREHPGMPEAKESSHTIVFDGEILRKSLAYSSYAVSKNDGNEALKGVLFQIQDGTLKTVSTDGRRLGAVFTEIQGNFPDFAHVISQSSVEAILRFLDEADGPVSFRQSSPYLYFSRVLSPAKEGGGDGVETMVVVKTIHAKFPPYQRIIPDSESIKYVFTAHRSSFVQSIRRVMAAVKEKGATIGIELHPGKVCLFHSGVIYGSGRDEFEVSISHCPDDFAQTDEPFLIQANHEYLLDVLSLLPSDRVIFSLIDKKSAIMIYGMVEDKKDHGQLHLVMPIFIH